MEEALRAHGMDLVTRVSQSNSCLERVPGQEQWASRALNAHGEQRQPTPASPSLRPWLDGGRPACSPGLQWGETRWLVEDEWLALLSPY